MPMHLSFITDYGALNPPEMVTLEESDERACFDVNIIDDLIALEDTESFTLRLVDPMLDGVILGRNSTLVNIIDDDSK